MRIFQFLFYMFYMSLLRRYQRETESDHRLSNAITAALPYSALLTINIVSILMLLTDWDERDWGGNFYQIVSLLFPLILLFVFIFVYVTCIRKEKYLEIVKYFLYFEKNLKRRFFAVLLYFIYIFATIIGILIII